MILLENNSTIRNQKRSMKLPNVLCSIVGFESLLFMNARKLISDPTCAAHLTYLHLNLQNFNSWHLMKVKTQCEQLASL